MNTAIDFEQFERRNEERILEARMRWFFEKYKPEDIVDACEFHTDFFMVVRTIYQDASKNSEKVMERLAQNIPPLNFIGKP